MNDGKNQPAEAFPLRVYLADEMEAREWSIPDLLRRTSIPEARLREMLCEADTYVTLREAEQLAYAFGVSAAVLLCLQATYRRWRRGR